MKLTLILLSMSTPLILYIIIIFSIKKRLKAVDKKLKKDKLSPVTIPIFSKLRLQRTVFRNQLTLEDGFGAVNGMTGPLPDCTENFINRSSTSSSCSNIRT